VARGELIARLVPVFSAMALRYSSRETYRHLLRFYEKFCIASGHDCTTPIGEQQLCEALIYFCSRRSVNSIGNFATALQWWHRAVGYGDLPRGYLYDRVRRGLTNVYGQFDKVNPASAITLDEIGRILPRCDLSTFVDARNWCALLFAFYGLLRVGEYCGSARAHRLRVQHVVVGDDHIALTVPWSKTDLQPHVVRICARDDLLCPLLALRVYSRFFTSARSADDSFFVDSSSSDQPLSPTSFRAWLKRKAALIGLDSGRVSGHSLRRGGTTAMFVAGVPESVIALHGRWRSMCYRRYFAANVPQLVATSILRDRTSGLFPSFLPSHPPSSTSSFPSSPVGT